MKSNRWICRMGVVCLCLATGWLAAPSPARAEPGAEEKKRLRACDHYMGAYARSASRKLARALAGQGYKLEKLPEQTTVEATVDGGTLRFAILHEKDRTAAGVVDKTRSHRTTYTIVHSDHGPVVTEHRWPSRDAIASGTECKPTSSAISFPKVPVAVIDVDPFKIWGLRTMWHLPTQTPAGVKSSEPLDILRRVMTGG